MSNHSNNPDQIDAKEVVMRLQNHQTLNLLDVREKIEYHTHNIGGVNIPVGQLQYNLNQVPWHTDDEIIVLCSKGLRSETAKSILQQNGYLHVRNLTGGLMAIQRLQSISYDG